jgi:hypothetical protein
MVLYADEESFTLMTPQGQMFAGWITFSATERDGETVAQAQVLMRASDPIFELGLTLGGHRQEDRFWNQTLASVAAHFGEPDREVDTQVVCVDKKRQWSKWRNVWHSSAIRSTLYMAGAPARGVSAWRHAAERTDDVRAVATPWTARSSTDRRPRHGGVETVSRAERAASRVALCTGLLRSADGRASVIGQ